MGKFEAPREHRSHGKGILILFSLLLVLALVITAFACFSKADQSKSGFQKIFSIFSFGPKEIKKESIGIDAARYQGTIDWEQAAQAGVEFAMIRVGYRTQVDGEIIEDGNARYNLQEAARNGIYTGAYFFSTAINPQEAREEAAWVADLLDPYPITFPVAYNCEGFLDPENRNHALTKEDRTTIAFAFLQALEDRGYEGMFYASRNELENDTQWITSELEKSYKIWVAQYPELPYPDTDASDYTGKHAMWQYTAQGNVAGIPQNVDCNLSYFSYSKPKAPKSSNAPAEAHPDPEALMNFEPSQESVTAKEETNLRSLPSQGPESQVLYTLKRGEIAQQIGVSSNGWSKLLFGNRTYYAVSSYLTTDLHGPVGDAFDDDGIQTEFRPVEDEEVTAKDTVNLRSIPSVEDVDVRIIGQLKNGDIAIRTGISENGWSRLRFEDQECYAITSYLAGPSGPEDTNTDSGSDSEIHTQFEEIDDQVTAKDAVNLRTRPTVQEGGSEVKIKLMNGQVVQRTGINRDLGWSRVVYEGQELYCITAYLIEADPGKTP